MNSFGGTHHFDVFIGTIKLHWEDDQGRIHTFLYQNHTTCLSEGLDSYHHNIVHNLKKIPNKQVGSKKQPITQHVLYNGTNAHIAGQSQLAKK